MTTHADLVDAAARWLRRRPCAVVITEMTSSAGETPDAIGWRGGWLGSLVVECKASLADFKADAHKPSRRRSANGGRPALGAFRWYLVPKGMARAVDATLAAQRSPWGLLVLGERGGVRRLRPAARQDSDLQAEVGLLISALRRIGSGVDSATARPVAVRAYTIDTQGNPRATLGIRQEDTE